MVLDGAEAGGQFQSHSFVLPLPQNQRCSRQDCPLKTIKEGKTTKLQFGGAIIWDELRPGPPLPLTQRHGAPPQPEKPQQPAALQVTQAYPTLMWINALQVQTGWAGFWRYRWISNNQTKLNWAKLRKKQGVTFDCVCNIIIFVFFNFCVEFMECYCLNSAAVETSAVPRFWDVPHSAERSHWNCKYKYRSINIETAQWLYA